MTKEMMGVRVDTLDPETLTTTFAPLEQLQTHTSGAKREKLGILYDLVPIEAIEAYSRVAEFGAKKYAPWNWAKGLPRMQIAASLIRHLWAYMRGEDCDKESGLAHTDHIVWNAVTLAHHHHHGMEDDRRPLAISTAAQQP